MKAIRFDGEYDINEFKVVLQLKAELHALSDVRLTDNLGYDYIYDIQNITSEMAELEIERIVELKGRSFGAIVNVSSREYSEGVEEYAKYYCEQYQEQLWKSIREYEDERYKS